MPIQQGKDRPAILENTPVYRRGLDNSEHSAADTPGLLSDGVSRENQSGASSSGVARPVVPSLLAPLGERFPSETTLVSRSLSSPSQPRPLDSSRDARTTWDIPHQTFPGPQTGHGQMALPQPPIRSSQGDLPSFSGASLPMFGLPPPSGGRNLPPPHFPDLHIAPLQWQGDSQASRNLPWIEDRPDTSSAPRHSFAAEVPPANLRTRTNEFGTNFSGFQPQQDDATQGANLLMLLAGQAFERMNELPLPESAQRQASPTQVSDASRHAFEANSENDEAEPASPSRMDWDDGPESPSRMDWDDEPEPLQVESDPRSPSLPGRHGGMPGDDEPMSPVQPPHPGERSALDAETNSPPRKKTRIAIGDGGAELAQTRRSLRSRPPRHAVADEPEVEATEAGEVDSGGSGGVGQGAARSRGGASSRAFAGPATEDRSVDPRATRRSGRLTSASHGQARRKTYTEESNDSSEADQSDFDPGSENSSDAEDVEHSDSAIDAQPVETPRARQRIPSTAISRTRADRKAPAREESDSSGDDQSDFDPGTAAGPSRITGAETEADSDAAQAVGAAAQVKTGEALDALRGLSARAAKTMLRQKLAEAKKLPPLQFGQKFDPIVGAMHGRQYLVLRLLFKLSQTETEHEFYTKSSYLQHLNVECSRLHLLGWGRIGAEYETMQEGKENFERLAADPPPLPPILELDKKTCDPHSDYYLQLNDQYGKFNFTIVAGHARDLPIDHYLRIIGQSGLTQFQLTALPSKLRKQKKGASFEIPPEVDESTYQAVARGDKEAARKLLNAYIPTATQRSAKIKRYAKLLRELPTGEATRDFESVKKSRYLDRPQNKLGLGAAGAAEKGRNSRMLVNRSSSYTEYLEIQGKSGQKPIIERVYGRLQKIENDRIQEIAKIIEDSIEDPTLEKLSELSRETRQRVIDETTFDTKASNRAVSIDRILEENPEAVLEAATAEEKVRDSRMAAIVTSNYENYKKIQQRSGQVAVSNSKFNRLRGVEASRVKEIAEIIRSNVDEPVLESLPVLSDEMRGRIIEQTTFDEKERRRARSVDRILKDKPDALVEILKRSPK
ncbi:MAG: hypothetical protein ABW032_03705 [Burkholderiaceae bacterium]